MNSSYKNDELVAARTLLSDQGIEMGAAVQVLLYDALGEYLGLVWDTDGAFAVVRLAGDTDELREVHPSQLKPPPKIAAKN